MHEGVIIKGIGGFYYVLSGDNVYECKARGIFRKEKITPLAGDNVEFEEKNGKGSIVRILSRKNFLIRPPVANVDRLVIVIAASAPEPNTVLIDKMLIQAMQNGIEAVICINKSELASRDDIEEAYSAAGYTVICVSAEKRENLSALHELTRGRITAFAGASGVGKSSLLNALTGAGMETGELSEKILRGKNTTRHVELIPIENGFVFDTPGFTSFEIGKIEPQELYKFYPEIEKYSGMCRYRDCAHTREQTDCAVKDALEDGKISKIRYDSYCELYKLLKENKTF